MNRQDMLKRFSDNDERLRFAKILDLVASCRNGTKRFSDFLDPIRLASYIGLLTKQNDFKLTYMVYGGYEGSERQMIGFAPERDVLECGDFPIEALDVEYKTGFGRKLTHRDYLGSILGLGIDRCKVGDITLRDNGCIIFITREISRYVIDNLFLVGNVKVFVKFAGELKAIAVDESLEKRIIISALRVDSVISAVFNLSRGKSSALVDGDKVFVNWALCSNGAKILKEGDMLTLRGYGRIKLKEVAGLTKKDRIVAVVSVNS